MSQLTAIVTASSMGATLSLTGDSGGAVTPDGGGNINVVGGAIGPAVVNITTIGNASPNTLDVALNDDVTLAGFLLAFGNVSTAANFSFPATATDGSAGVIVNDGDPFIHTAGTNSVYVGDNAGNLASGGIGNTVVGSVAYQSGGGDSNTIVGFGAFNAGSGNSNTALGFQALNTSTSNNAIGIGREVSATGDFGIAIGYLADTADYSVCIGANAGSSSGGVSNIYISNVGAAEANTIRIGTQGNGNGEQDTAYIAGIYGVTPGGATETVIIDANGQLGSVATSSGFTWNEETGTSASMAVNNGYIANNAGLVTLTLPAAAVIGDSIRVSGKGAGGWRIAQNAGQTIYFGTSATTTGATGRLDSTEVRDSIELVCVTANNDWNVLSAQGNITVT